MLRFGWAWFKDFMQFEGLAIMVILSLLALLGVFQIS